MSYKFQPKSGIYAVIVSCFILFTCVIQISAQDTSDQGKLFETYITRPGETESKIEELLELAASDRDKGLRLKALEKIQIALILEKELIHPNYIAFKLNSFVAKFTGTIDHRYCLEFYRKAAALANQIAEVSPPEKFIMYTDRAGVHALLMEFDSAIHYYRIAMEAAIADSPTSVASSYNNLGVFYNKQAQYDSAKVYFEKAL